MCNNKNCFSMFDLAKKLQYGAYLFPNNSMHEIKKAMCKTEQQYFQFWEIQY